jgi:ketosteroid isomerase-like protein
MRRLVVLISILALAVQHLGGAGVMAQQATPAASPVALPPLLQQLVDAINAGDSAAFAALYTEDGVYVDVPAGLMVEDRGVAMQGREEIADFIDLELSRFHDARLEPVSGRQAGDLAVLEYTLYGADAMSGLPVVSEGVLVFDLDGDLIRRGADYYDMLAIFGQLGLLDDGEATVEATPTS